MVSGITPLADAIQTSERVTEDRFEQYINPEFASILSTLGLDKTFVEANGVTVRDIEGEEYLDFLGGYGSLNLGHNHPAVDDAIKQVQEMPNFLQVSFPSVPSALAESLAAVTPGDLEKVFFSSSGSEAVEGALKLARISTGNEKILTTETGYHGTTFGAVSVTGKGDLREPFEPLVPGVDTVPFGDTTALRERLRADDCAAFIVEPIQGEAGIQVPPEGYLKEVERICHETNTLFIADEIQTGLGRTGELWACDHAGAEPDIMTMAKSLSGGAIPMGAYIATDEVWQAGYGTPEKAMLHASTFTNNTRGCAAGLKTLEVLHEEDLTARAAELGEYFLSELESVADEHKMLADVRGWGLMLGLEFYEPRIGKSMSEEYLSALFASLLLKEHNIITAYTTTNPNVLRLEPPLTVNKGQIDTVVEAIDAVCDKYGSFASVMKSFAGSRLKDRLGIL